METFIRYVKRDSPQTAVLVDEAYIDYNSDPEVKTAFPGGAPVLDAGDAFSPAYDQRRRGTFMAAMSESFGQCSRRTC